MSLKVELFDLFFERKSRSYLSILEVNKSEPLLYLEWGQSYKIQIGLFFGLIKNY